jgi:hypothetical protein
LEQKRTQQTRAGSATPHGYRTTVTVASSAIDGYALLLETFDDPAHALPRVFRSMFSHPKGKVKRSLEWGSYENEYRMVKSKDDDAQY